MRHLLVVLAVAACGENRIVPPDTSVPEPVAPIGECGSHGRNIYLRQIAVAAVQGTVTLVTGPPNDDRLFVVMDAGRIWIIDRDQASAEPFLDITTGVLPQYVGGSGQELGLLGLAFHPQFATNHTFFINYTAINPANDPLIPYLDVTMRMQTSETDPNTADPSTAAVVLAIPDFAANHNGGMLEFGPDGYLYIGTGDGGSANDPVLNGQNPHALLAKILRIDVDNTMAGQEYSIPADNPHADGIGGVPEMFIMGVRNPWRFTFDRETGDLWIGDVGQATIEEVDVLHPWEQNGANLGWSMYEGPNCFNGPCDPTGLTFPKDARIHGDWCAIIGGEVYRGGCYPDLLGDYFYTDYCRGGLSRARLRNDDTLEIEDLPNELPVNPASLHSDSHGELYVADLYGNIFHLEAMP